MTLFAGIYSFKPDGIINNDIIQLFKSSLSRRAGEFNVYSNHTFAIVKYDCKAFGVPGFAENSTSVAALAGEPYLSDVDGVEYSRYSDLLTISEKLARGHLEILRSCRGTYSICIYNKNENSLVLATDKLGERPIYYFIGDDYLFFSSKLGVLEKVDLIPKKMNLSAFIEERAFGVPLGNNTYYCDIKLSERWTVSSVPERPEKNSALFQMGSHRSPQKEFGRTATAMLRRVQVGCFKPHQRKKRGFCLPERRFGFTQRRVDLEFFRKKNYRLQFFTTRRTGRGLCCAIC